jgi:hypothetical protein
VENQKSQNKLPKSLTKLSSGWFLSSSFAIPLRSILWQKFYLKTTAYNGVMGEECIIKQ